jgi:hypothetical protein
MQQFLQQLIVVVIVTAAAGVSVWKLMPARRRLIALVQLDAWLARHGWLPGWRGRVLAKRIQKAAGSGCAGCAANVGTDPRHPR